MGIVVDIAVHKAKKMDCQGEVVEFPTPERSVRATEAAKALSVCVNLMRAEFGDKFTMENLANELHRMRSGCSL